MANVQVCIFNPVTRLIDQIVAASAGPAAAGVPVVTNSNGLVDASLLGIGVLATAGENLSAGQLVNLYESGGTLFAQRASAAATGTAPSGDPYPREAQGFANSDVFTSATLTINFTGVLVYLDGNSEFSASSIGLEVFLSATTPGGITLTSPSGPGELEESVGYVVAFAAPNVVTVRFMSGFQDFSHISGVNPISKGGTGATTGAQALINLIAGSPAINDVLMWDGTAWVSGPAMTPFSDILSGTNTTATMTVGTGATLTFSGSGVVNANQLQGSPVSSAAPATGQVLTWTGSAWAASGGTIAKSDNAGLTASLPLTTLITPATTGMFRASAYAECSVAGANGAGSPFGSGVFGAGVFNPSDDSVQVVVGWTDDVAARTALPFTLDLGNTNSASGDVFIRAVAGQTITIQTYLIHTGSPTYSVYARLESL